MNTLYTYQSVYLPVLPDWDKFSWCNCQGAPILTKVSPKFVGRLTTGIFS